MAYTTIDDPSQYFQTALWSGDNATTQDITNDGNSDLQPDWVWVKCRNTSGNGFDHVVFDTSRGVSNSVNTGLSPSQTDSEGLGDNVTTTAQLGGVSAMLSDGFTVREGTLDNDSRYVNESSRTYVAWQWKANGGTTTSFSASGAQLAGTRQSNTTAGFSIITYTGDGNNNATIPHGLNSAPKFVIIKDRGNATNWYVGHNSTFTTGEVFLNLNNGLAAAFGPFNKTAPTSSNIVLGTDGNVNGSGDTMICYAFAEVQGYSKFSSYAGNGNTDGPFVYLGFKPAWIMIKRTDSGSSQWHLFDSTRNEFNVANKVLFPSTDDAEQSYTGTDPQIDILSNGFKLRSSYNQVNSSSGTYIYMCFAEHPFVSSEGVPTTAR